MKNASSKTPSRAQNETGKPELFPLPQRGQDPYLGLGRSSWYDLERRGLLQLVRVRKPGNVNGKVLIPYAKALAAINKLAETASQTPEGT